MNHKVGSWGTKSEVLYVSFLQPLFLEDFQEGRVAEEIVHILPDGKWRIGEMKGMPKVKRRFVCKSGQTVP